MLHCLGQRGIDLVARDFQSSGAPAGPSHISMTSMCPSKVQPIRAVASRRYDRRSRRRFAYLARASHLRRRRWASVQSSAGGRGWRRLWPDALTAVQAVALVGPNRVAPRATDAVAAAAAGDQPVVPAGGDEPVPSATSVEPVPRAASVEPVPPATAVELVVTTGRRRGAGAAGSYRARSAAVAEQRVGPGARLERG